MISILLTLLTLASPTPADASPTDPAGTVTVTVTGAESDDGRLVVLLWNDDDGFPQDAEKAYRRVEADLEDGRARVRIADVPAGRYAVMAFHDADGDGEVKTNLLGMPREGIALSRWSGGRPSFERSLVRVGENSVVSIELVYL